jgi:L-asparaginase/Glu-tRNA(Gln) amidotransferase subunit D
MKKVLLISLGGTIDSEPYSTADGEYPPDATPMGRNWSREALTEIFARAHAGVQIDHVPICDLDSKQINDLDREKLLQTVLDVRDNDYDRIIVTMGTDRMCVMAQALEAQLQALAPGLQTPIVFTGAIWPLSNKDIVSDGIKNLESASGAPAGPGVHICMGDIFSEAVHVYKDPAKKLFVDRVTGKTTAADVNPALIVQ